MTCELAGPDWRSKLRTRAARADVPLTAQLELTRRCNFRCGHCYAGPAAGADGELDTAAWKAILDEAADAGYAEHFMNRGENKVRFLGHGIGLEMDEVPILARRFTEPLAAGMVFAVEPKIIFDDGGVGVEDTIVVGAGGGEVVTPLELGLMQVG